MTGRPHQSSTSNVDPHSHCPSLNNHVVPSMAYTLAPQSLAASCGVMKMIFRQIGQWDTFLTSSPVGSRSASFPGDAGRPVDVIIRNSGHAARSSLSP